MTYKNLLITGGSGRLGKALINSNLKSRNIFAPPRRELDITKKENVADYFREKKIEAIIHCAALTKMLECEQNPSWALEVNTVGTCNLVEETIRNNLRFIYISTDYVYPCINGPYKEDSSTIPFTVYGWTKLGGECATKLVKNHCSIRTSFFESDKISFDTAPYDSFCSKMPIFELVEAIIFLLDSEFIGTVNVGQKKASLYDIYKKYKPEIKPVSLEEISKGSSTKRAIDSSLDISLWKKVSKNRFK